MKAGIHPNYHEITVTCSPRNNIWLKRNPWFEVDLLPVLRARVAEVLAHRL